MSGQDVVLSLWYSVREYCWKHSSFGPRDGDNKELKQRFLTPGSCPRPKQVIILIFIPLIFSLFIFPADISDFFLSVTKPRHKGERSLTNKNTKHKQTRENTQQLNISLQIFITTTTLLINLHEYNN